MITVTIIDIETKKFNDKTYYKVAVKVPNSGIAFINIYDDVTLMPDDTINLIPYVTKNHTIGLKADL